MFTPIHPGTYVCRCRKRRKFHTNADGLRIWRCGDCEADDIREYLSGNYGDSSKQFLANLLRSPRLVILSRADGTEIWQTVPNEIEAMRWLEQNMNHGDEFRIEPAPVLSEKPRLTAQDLIFLKDAGIKLW
jgi:hypothetical protein